MQVPSPLPLQNPWSPVGYQVCEVGEANTPDRHIPSTRPAPEGRRKTIEPARTPWSPVGCRVVQVAEEKTPPRPRADSAEPCLAVRPIRKKSGPPVPAVVLLVLIFFLMTFLSLVSLVALAVSTPTPPVVVVNDQPGQPMQVGWQQQAFIPAGVADLPVREKTKEPAPENQDLVCDKGDCKVGDPKSKETFGTSVAFVRNPGIASGMAKQQQKLTFVLHVSGNFEDSRFT